MKKCDVGVEGRDRVLVAVAVELELRKVLRHEALRRLCGEARGDKSLGLELDVPFFPFFHKSMIVFFRESVDHAAITLPSMERVT